MNYIFLFPSLVQLMSPVWTKLGIKNKDKILKYAFQKFKKIVPNLCF